MASPSSSSSWNDIPKSFKELMETLSSSDEYPSPSIIVQSELETPMLKVEHQMLCNVLLASPSSCSRLERLSIYGSGDDDDDERRVDGEVAQCYARLLGATPSLEWLFFYNTRIGGDAFHHILNSVQSSTLKITHLSFLGDDSIGDNGIRHLAPILSTPILPLQSLALVCIGMGAKGAAHLAKSLSTNTSLLSLDISWNDIGELGMEAMSHMLLSNTTLQKLQLQGLSPPLAKHLGVALLQNKTLLTLDISYDDEIGEEGMELLFPDTNNVKHLVFRNSRRIFKRFAKILRHNTTITTLDLSDNQETESSRVEELFRAIADNRFLESLNLSGCEAMRGHRVVSCILDSLRVNSCLTHLDIHGTPLEKEGHVAVIEAQLKQIKEEKEMGFPRMRKAKLKRIRVFLCGLPSAGKTTLKNSMIRASKGRLHTTLHALSQARLDFANERTRGIDIGHILFSGITVSLWDLAGQEDFYSFHDFMFPDISHVGNPSLFFILCNPFYEQGYQKEIERMGREIKYWLRFIGSKARQSETFKPIVAIVFTHKDKQNDCSNVFSMLNLVDAIRVDFQAHLDLSNKAFHVNAKSSRSSYKILQYVHETASTVLESWPRTYSCCDQVCRLLNRWKRNHLSTPIMHKSDFILLCNNIQELKVIGFPSTTDANTLSEEQKLVAHTLNNAGDIIFFPDLEYIVVDLVWFCKNLIGQMIKFEGMPSQQIEGKREELIDWHKFVAIVNNSLSKKKNARGDPEIEAKLIVQIMQKMSLCFTRNTTKASTPDVFIPSNLSLTQDSKSWEFNICIQNQSILGRRLQCLDPDHTILTPNFFPQIQIALYNIFAEDENFECTLMKDFVKIIDKEHYGMEIHLEFHGYGNDDMFDLLSPKNLEYEYPPVYIDLLLKSAQRGDKSLKRLSTILIKEIREFCAKWRGCQGVTLIEGILRPDCVEQPEKYKIKQCVLVSTLQDNLMKIPASEMHADTYCWKEFYSMKRRIDNTKELLGDEAFMEVMSKRMKDVQAVAVELEKETIGKEKLLATIASKGALDSPPSTNECQIYSDASMDNAEKSRKAKGKNVLMEDSRISLDMIIAFMQDHFVQIKEDVGRVYQRVDRVGRDVGRVLQTVEQLSQNLICMEEKVVYELGTQIRAVLDIVNKQGASVQHNIPHLFYFTQKNDGMRERVAKLLASVDCYRLRFLCEGLPSSQSSSSSSSSSIGSRQQHHHEVEGSYEGLRLFFARNERLRKAMPYLNKVLNVVTLVAKVGAHVVAGAGELVPDLAKLPALVFDAAVIDVASMKVKELLEPEVLQIDHPSKEQNQSVEQWLVDILIENECFSGNAISKTFGLYRVKHKESFTVAWVCDEHKKHPEFVPFPL